MSKSTTLTEAITEYQAHCTARGLEQSTIKNNGAPLRAAVREWGDIQMGSITGQHIDRLFRAATWGPSTRNLYLGCLRSFFAWSRREGHISRDFEPTEGWRNARIPRKDRLRVPVGEFSALLDTCRHPRDRIVVALGLYTFMRGGEIVTLDIGCVDLERFTLTMYRWKTKEEDVLPICSELATELERWFAWYRKDQSRASLPHQWKLVPAKWPNPTRYNRLTRRIEVDTDALPSVRPERGMGHPYRSVQRSLELLGYPTHMEGEHTLRRSGARALFDTLRTQGYDGALMRVSSFLGHKDTRVTEKYIGLSLERTQRNEHFAGKSMFAPVVAAKVIPINVKEG